MPQTLAFKDRASSFTAVEALRVSGLVPSSQKATLLRRRRSKAVISLAEIDWESVVQRFEAGERMRPLCSGRAGMPAMHQWRKKKSLDPVFASRVDAALEGRVGGKVNPATVAKVIQDIEAGKTIKAALAGTKLTKAGLTSLRRKNLTLGAQVAGLVTKATEERIVRKAETLDRFVGTLRIIGSVRATVRELGVSRSLIDQTARQDVQFRARLQPLLRRSGHSLGGLRSGIRLERAFAHREAFVRHLRDDEIYAAVHAAARSLSPDIRDDVISDLIVAVLDGEIVVADLPREVGRFRAAHNLRFGIWTPSLDAPIGDGNFTIGNSMAAAYF